MHGTPQTLLAYISAIGSTQKAPSTVREELVRAFIDVLHDGPPVQIDGSFGQWNVNRTLKQMLEML